MQLSGRHCQGAQEKGTSLIVSLLWRLSRSPRVSEGEGQAEAFGGTLNPILLATRPAAVDARSELLKLFLIKRSIDKSHPVSGPIHGPFAKAKRLAAPTPGI